MTDSFLGSSRGLRREDLDADPLEQFRRWFDEGSAGVPEPGACVLATATPEGRPSARVVLFRGFDAGAFLVFTNYESRKATELDRTGRAALVFHWPALLRQVRVEGRTERAPDRVSDDYFASRPRESQLGAWASPQSEVVSNRASLDQRYADVAGRFAGKPVPRPPYWGGYRIVPETVEFWSHRDGRMHDRLCYVADEGRGWKIDRLAP